MKKTIILIAAIALGLASCQKEFDLKPVTYRVTGLGQAYTVAYMNEEGMTITEEVTPASTNEVWTYSFTGRQGDILYLYIKYYDVDPPKEFRMAIYVDGKMLRYADDYDTYSSTPSLTFYAKRSGIIPY